MCIIPNFNIPNGHFTNGESSYIHYSLGSKFLKLQFLMVQNS
jgi:hypothetical protein